MQVTSDKQNRRVEMTVISGTSYDGPDTRKRDTYSLSQTTARALSSALMGAAAEV